MTFFDYYKFQTNIAIEKITEEINFYESCEYHGVLPVTERVIYLRNRLGLNKPNSSMVESFDRYGNKFEVKKMNLDEYAKDMNSLVFNRPWNKLKEFHKIMKIDEYVDNLTYDSKKSSEEKINKNKQYIKDKIIEGLRTKKFTKNKSVIEYDQNKMIIKSISCLDHIKKKNSYEIDWDS